MATDRNYMSISIATGAVIGAGYGFKHPSEEVCKKLALQKPTITETMKGYFDCFDMMKASEAIRSKALSADEYEKTNNIRKAIYNTYQKEKQIIDIMNMPIQDRPITFKQAVREANKTRPELYKKMIGLNGEFKQKLIDLQIFNTEKFSEILKATAKKTTLVYKELSKGAVKGLAVGTVIGTAIGYFLNNISRKS
jgi:hypothetical protein